MLWVQITDKEFEKLLAESSKVLEKVIVTRWVDFLEEQWQDKETGDRVLYRTCQENFDEVTTYPPTVKYFRWEK